MSLRPKHYFLAPTGNPPEGPIQLGNIVSLPRLVDDPLNEEQVALSTVAGMDVIEHNEPNYSLDINTKKGGHIGIWASFLLQVLGVGGDAKAQLEGEVSEQWQCTNIQTLSFTPKLAYIVKCLEDDGVQRYLRVNKPWFGSCKLYMITGIKIAYGASSTVRWSKIKGLNLHFGVDLTSLGIPLQVGPDVAHISSVTVTESQDGAEPFVFAFRLRRLKIFSSGSVEHRQYDKGTMLGIHRQRESESDDKVEVLVEGIEDEDADGSEFGLQSHDVRDEASEHEESCRCTVLQD